MGAQDVVQREVECRAINMESFISEESPNTVIVMIVKIIGTKK